MTTCRDVAKSVVAMLNALTGSPITCQAATVDVPVTDRQVSRATIHVQPWEEDEERIDHDGLRLVRTVNVILQAPIEGAISLERCERWLSFVKEALRDATLAPTDGSEFHWQKNTTLTLADSEALAERSQFLSLFRAEFFDYR